MQSIVLNATNRPCAEIAGSKPPPLAWCPAGPTDTRVLTAPDLTPTGVAAAATSVPTTSVATPPRPPSANR
jgi:hypothetical protein